MNQIDEKEILKKAKRKFVTHQNLNVYVKRNAFVPYEKSWFKKIISDSKPPLRHKHYVIRLHDYYLTVIAKDFVFEPIRLPIDDKLWVELYCVFNLEKD